MQNQPEPFLKSWIISKKKLIHIWEKYRLTKLNQKRIKPFCKVKDMVKVGLIGSGGFKGEGRREEGGENRGSKPIDNEINN